MFFRIRAGIYCDHAVQHLFDYHGEVDEDSAIYRLETMLLDYLKSEFHLARHPGMKKESVMRNWPHRNQPEASHILRPNLENFCQGSQKNTK